GIRAFHVTGVQTCALPICKETRYWTYRTFRTSFNPQLRLQGRLPVYDKSVNQVIQGDGSYRYIPVEQTNNNLTMALEQPLWFTEIGRASWRERWRIREGVW